MKDKLENIGKKLDISNKDIKRIRKAGFSNKILYWIIAVAIVIVSFFVGFFIGKGVCSSSSDGLPVGYPYASAIPIFLSVNKKKRTKIVLLLLSLLVFLVALKTAPVFGQAIKYNVYKK